ncbi:MAG: hypothetical protein Q7R60_01255 [bacterium]|nr:hypothetical protein [bacterium]
MGKANNLHSQFRPEKYELDILEGRVIIFGRKLPPPSKRITFHQKGLKIISAKITRLDKKGATEHDVARINHLPTFEQVRLHTASMLYPGQYIIELSFQLDPQKIKALKNLGDKKPSRHLLPSIDEPEAWDNASFEIK